MKFSETVKLSQPELVISKRHDAWLADDDRRYSNLAISFAMSEFTKKARVRKGTVSASSLGECRRYQQFVYLGMPKLPFNAKNAMKMANGEMMHLRWQMDGLSEGWLADAEVPVYSEQLGLRGTMDGITFDHRILELKSINANGFRRVHTFGPLVPHLFQMATYMLCTGKSRGVFIYECKDDQEYHEIPVEVSDVPLVEAKLRAEDMWGHINRRELFEPLGKCIDREGWQYHSCPFRDRCLEIKTWEEAL